MPAENLRKLVERTGQSPWALTHQAGVPHNRLAYWLRPTTVVDRIPPLDRLEEIADILPGVELVEVSRAFAADVGLVLDDLDDDEFDLVIAYRRLSRRDRRNLRAMADVLARHAPARSGDRA